MSTYTEVRVECDAKGRPEAIRIGSHHGGTNITLARREADVQGWQRSQGKDLCVEHRTTPIPFHAFVAGTWGGKSYCDSTVGQAPPLRQARRPHRPHRRSTMILQPTS